MQCPTLSKVCLHRSLSQVVEQMRYFESIYKKRIYFFSLIAKTSLWLLSNSLDLQNRRRSLIIDILRTQDWANSILFVDAHEIAPIYQQISILFKSLERIKRFFLFAPFGFSWIFIYLRLDGIQEITIRLFQSFT